MFAISLRRLFRILFFAICSLLSYVSYASTYTSTTSNWFLAIGGGASRTTLPSSTTVSNGAVIPPPYNEDTLSVQNQTDPIVQLLVGKAWHNENQFLPYSTVFVQYRHYFRESINGTIDQFSAPGFENYNYKMSYAADMFTLNGKVNLFQCKKISPYLSVGVGFILNHINDYSESALANVTPRISPAYNGNTIANLAGTLGAGIDFTLTKNYWLTLGYDHVFQGNIKSGAGASSWSNTSLNFGNIKLDTVFINFSAKFPQGFRS